MTKTTDSLSEVQKAQLAREVAADSYNRAEELVSAECDECGMTVEVDAVPLTVVREAVKHGWDAAMQYAAKKIAEGIEHLDDQDEHDSRNG
jgi:hypothetical protein